MTAAPQRLGGRRVVLIVTGGIAAYKSCLLVRELKREGAEVQVILTSAAAQFVTPLTFTTLSGRQTLCEMFPAPPPPRPIHLEPAEWGEILAVAPASADFIAKMACGLADDLASTVAAAWLGATVVAPAMNPRMWSGAALQENISTLRRRGAVFCGPVEGAMGGVGETPGLGRMSEPADIVDCIEERLHPRPLEGKKVLVTSGPTREALDPVRFLSNRSSGRMGDAIARQATLMGAEVTLVRGGGASGPPPRVAKTVIVESASQMAMVVKEAFAQCDLLVMTAAVADWTPASPALTKLKKSDGPPQVAWRETEDILAWAGSMEKRPVLIGFALETANHLSEAQKKLAAKGADIIALNDPTRAESAFGGDSIQLTLVQKDREPLELPVLPKWAAAKALLERAETLLTSNG